MAKESDVGIGCSGELPFVFEMSQALMVLLAEYSGKVGDFISVKLFAFFLWKANMKWLQAEAYTVRFCHWMWSIMVFTPCETNGEKSLLSWECSVLSSGLILPCAIVWVFTALTWLAGLGIWVCLQGRKMGGLVKLWSWLHLWGLL